MIRVTLPFFNSPSPGCGSFTRTNSLLRRSAALCFVMTVLWSAHLYSCTPQLHQRLTLCNDNNPAVMPFSMCCQAHVKSLTNQKTAQLTICGGRSTIGVLPPVVEVSSVTTRVYPIVGTTRLLPVDDDLIDESLVGSVTERGPCSKEPRSALRRHRSSPAAGLLFPRSAAEALFNILLQRMKYSGRSRGSVTIIGHGEPGCEGIRGSMRHGIKMTGSEAGSYFGR